MGISVRTQVALALLVAAVPVAAEAQSCPQTPASPVYPGNTAWTADTQGQAGLAITGANPRSGNGSLELTATGNLADWAFYKKQAPTGSFGLLSQLQCLSFDWFRQSVVTPTDVPWSAQSPVLRLFINDGGIESELVWEKYYTNSSPTVNDVWHAEDLFGQNFWRIIPGQGYTVAGCQQLDPFFPTPLLTSTPAGWSAGSCFSGQAVVTALSVGIGSNWPYQYHGYVDNVRLGFAGDRNLAVHDNFELTPVPEPSTVALMATGLAAMLGAGWVRRRRGGPAAGSDATPAA